MFQEVQVPHGVALSHFTFRVRQPVQALGFETITSDGGVEEGLRGRISFFLFFFGLVACGEHNVGSMVEKMLGKFDAGFVLFHF